MIENTFPLRLKPRISFACQAALLKLRRFKAAVPARYSAICITGLLLAMAASLGQAQQTAQPAPAQSSPAQAATANPSKVPAATSPAAASPAVAADQNAKSPRLSDRRRAAKLYISSSKLFVAEQFEEALRGYEEAAKLDPANADYPLAAGVARSHAVMALIQAAAKDRLRGDAAAARATLTHAHELDPESPLVAEHLNELGDEALLGQTRPLYEQAMNTIGDALELQHTDGVHSFHLHSDRSQIVRQVFKAYGVEADVDQSIQPTQIRLDVDDASFEQAMRALEMVTKSFYVPLDAHRVLVLADTKENRQQFTRQELETVYLSGLTKLEMTDVINVAKSVFQAQAEIDYTSGTIIIRGSESTLNAINATIRALIDGRSQVMLDVRLIQLAHTSQRNTGIQPPQQITAFNAYSAEQSILNANQSLVQQIISSGLAAPGDTLAILGILLASGQVSSSLFSNGIALFGNGLTLSGLSPGPGTMNINLNSSDSRELDQIQMHLGDGEDGSLKLGTRYPIQTSSFSSLGSSLPSIPGLTGAGNSGSLSSLLSSLSSSVPNVPQVQYQDLGLTLKATPKVMRDDDVALKIDMKIDALAGSSVNGNPILNNRSYQGVVTIRQGQGVVVASELDKQQSRAISGLPGISDIPGLNNVSDINAQKSYSTLLIVITPHVIRFTQAAGHTPMMRIENFVAAH